MRRVLLKEVQVCEGILQMHEPCFELILEAAL